jgi:hypothetical protein
MANPATKAPNFTRENARAMQIKATASRLARIQREKDELQAMKDALARIPETEDARRTRTLKQLDMLDALIDRALNLGNSDKFLKLSAAKEKIWKLVQPTAGVLRPKKREDRVCRPTVQPIELP